MLIQILLEKNVKASKICDIIKLYPQVLINVKVKDDKKYEIEKDEEIKKEIENITKEIGQDGRIIIRSSRNRTIN